MELYEQKVIYESEFNADAPLMVDKIAIEWMLELDPDLSYLGSYGRQPEGEHYIDRQERGEMGRHEARYFNLGCGEPDYIEKDYERYEAYNRGDWRMLGVRAVITLSYPTGQGCRRTQDLCSGGLWGIESDSNPRYKEDVEREQLDELKEHVKTLTTLDISELLTLVSR